MRDRHDAVSQREDEAHVDTVVRASGTSFYWAIRMLPDEKRRAMFAVYAFCREVDDIADEPGSVTAKLAALRGWREEIDRVFAGEPRRALSRALVEPVRRFRLRREDFIAVIDGMEMDAAARVRICDLAELALYCDRVACAVGRLSVRVFGADDGTGDRLASALGTALQLTNILRDLKEDARRDRLYLPADLLLESGIDDTEEAEAVLARAESATVCRRLAEMAQSQFTEASRLVAACNPRQVRPAAIMMEVYRRTLQRLMARGWSRWDEPVSVPSWERLWVAFRFGVI